MKTRFRATNSLLAVVIACGAPERSLQGAEGADAEPGARLRCSRTERLTSTASEDDWPAATSGTTNDIWVAYVAYEHGSPIDLEGVHEKRDFSSLVTRGHGDQVRLVRHAGVWEAPQDVTAGGLDVWRPAVALDASGSVWVFWSQLVDGNWDLYSRSHDPESRRWSGTRRLTESPGADVYAVALRNPVDRRIHVVWQGWRGGSFDILHLELDGKNASAEQSLAASDANEWCPSAAFDSRGTLHVAFDTYRKGNYDVRLASVRGDEVRTLDIAASADFEARPSLAVDGRDRVWVAYERSGPNWAKDSGLRWPGSRADRPYLWREVDVRCVANDRIEEIQERVPAEPVEAGYPRGSEPPHRRLALPRLTFDGGGRLWLLYRRHLKPVGEGEAWVSYATFHDGSSWSPAVELPRSANLLDNRPALIPLGRDTILVVRSTDDRTQGTPSAKQNDLFASLLEASGTTAPLPLAPPAAAGEAVDSIHADEEGDLRRIREYRPTIGGKAYRLLRGEFHRHTELTSHQDMDGPLEDMWRYAMDSASMDWIGNGDHDNGYGKEYLWWLVQKQTDIFHHPPRFVPMFTYERSVSFPSGHRNAMFARRGIRPLPRISGGNERLMGTAEEGSPDIKSFYAYLRHFSGICASHTSGTGMGTDWRDNDPDVEPVVEIFQGCRQSYEHLGAPATAKDAEDSIGGYRPAGFVWKALMKGHRLGFQSSSDHYSAHISYAVVYAESSTREAILDAFRKRHCYAAHDNIILDVRAGDRMMGDVFSLEGKPTLRIHAVGTRPIAKVSVIRGVGSDEPRYVYDAEPGQREVTLTWTDAAPEWGKASYYYVRVEQERPAGGGFGALAWASPLWITPQRP